tara:strand:- start:2867 stop:3403 length:537 start_codon:yes stop_codon:yes gene_type:complete
MNKYEYLDIKFGIKNYNSNNKPFFLQIDDVSNNCNEDYKKVHEKEYDKVDKYIEINLNILPIYIRDFYIYCKTIDKEIYIHKWTFMSLSNILKIYENYKSQTIKIVDIAFRYDGMGNIKVLFYDPRIDKINFRMDGGSNSHEREDNFNKLIEYNNNEPPNDISYNFDILLNNISYNVI